MSGHLLTRWADLLMAHAWRAGVRHVVISPGSRSTAFVLAAHRHEGLRCHDAIDERVAGFFALYDFPPLLYGMIDAHALWHLCTAPVALVFYDFLLTDARNESKGLTSYSN